MDDQSLNDIQQSLDETTRKFYIFVKYRRWFVCSYCGCLSRTKCMCGLCDKCNHDDKEEEYNNKYFKPFSSCMAWILNLYVRFNQWRNNEYDN